MVKKEKGKDKVEENKSIALKTSSLKPSYIEKSDYKTRDYKNFDDEDMRLFVKRYQRYISMIEVKHSDKNLTKLRRVAKASREDENKKGKFRSSCYNYGEFGHYILKYPKIKKDKEKGITRSLASLESIRCLGKRK